MRATATSQTEALYSHILQALGAAAAPGRQALVSRTGRDVKYLQGTRFLRWPKLARPAHINQKLVGESMNGLRFLVTAIVFLLASLPAAYGQSVTGQISGTVADSAGAVIPGASVKLTHDLSQQV